MTEWLFSIDWILVAAIMLYVFIFISFGIIVTLGPKAMGNFVDIIKDEDENKPSNKDITTHS